MRLGLGLPVRERKTVEDTEPSHTLTHHQSTHYTLTSRITTKPETAADSIYADSNGCGWENGKEEGEGDEERRSEWEKRQERPTGKKGDSSHTSLSHKTREDILNYLSR